MADAQSILTPLAIPNSVKADVWDAYQAATNGDDLAKRLKTLPLANSVRADLWDAYAANPPARVAPESSDQGFLHGLAESLNPIPALKAVFNNPLGPAAGVGDLVSGMVDAHVDQGRKAAAAWRSGDRTEAVGHAMAAALPVFGPAAANAGEAIGEGRTGEGLGQAAGLIGSVIAPGLLKDVSPAALAKLKGAATVLPDATDEFISNLAGDVAKRSKWLPGGQKYSDLLNQIKAGRDASRAARAAAEAKANPAVLRDANSPAYTNFPQDMAQAPPEFTPTPATATPSGRVPGSAARAAAARTTAETVPPPNALPASDVGRVFDGIEFAPPETPPEPPAPAPPPVAPPEPAPAPTYAQGKAAFEAAKAEAKAAPGEQLEPWQQQLQDSVDEMKARKAASTEAVKNANATKAADRWTGNLQKFDVKVPAIEDDARWADLSAKFDERKGYVPSLATRQLILDRVDAAATKAADAPLRKRLIQTLDDPDAAPSTLGSAMKKGK